MIKETTPLGQGPGNEQPQGRPWLPMQFKPSEEDIETADGKKRTKKNVREYTLGEEIMNSITHGVGALLAVAALPILCVLAVGKGGGLYLFSALVYAITLILEYVMSTMYHALAVPKAKKVFKVLDHSCIYLLIAGTYTPFCLISLGDVGGIWLFIFVWTCAIAGVATEAFWVFRPRWVSAVLYLLIGWSIILFIPALIDNLAAGGLWLLLAGGICYTIGCIFYVLKKIPYMHSIFHLWVLAGSICHFFAVAIYIM